MIHTWITMLAVGLFISAVISGLPKFRVGAFGLGIAYMAIAMYYIWINDWAGGFIALFATITFFYFATFVAKK